MLDANIPQRLQTLLTLLRTSGRVAMHSEQDTLTKVGLTPSRLPVYITELRHRGIKIETVRSNRKTIEYRLAPTQQ